MYDFTKKNVILSSDVILNEQKLGHDDIGQETERLTRNSHASDACPNDIHGLHVGGCDVRNSSNSFALRWRVFSSEVAKLKWFCFDLALKLALYT